MGAIASWKNGRVHGRQGSYLYFSVQNSFWRFYHPNFDDIGPTNDEGLPTNRQGPVSGFVPYPGRFYISIDAGVSGYSSVLANTGGTSYHESYRAPLGQRIYDIGFQVVPGNSPDRMWILQGADLLYIPFPSETYDPYTDSNYLFTHEGVIEQGEMTAGLYDVFKYWNKQKIRSRNLIRDDETGIMKTWMEYDYRVSEDDAWSTLRDPFSISPVEEHELEPDYGVSSQILYGRIRMYSADQTKTPKLLATALSGVTVSEPKFTYEVTVAIGLKDKNGDPIDASTVETMKILDKWCGIARPLRLGSHNPLYDNKRVFLMPLPTDSKIEYLQVGEYEYKAHLILQEA